MYIDSLPSLRFYRERAMLAQTDLAELSGVSRSTILHIEDGQRCFPRIALKLARALRVSVDQLAERPKRQHPTSYAPLEAEAVA